jgi:hypothetical protein
MELRGEPVDLSCTLHIQPWSEQIITVLLIRATSYMDNEYAEVQALVCHWHWHLANPGSNCVQYHARA